MFCEKCKVLVLDDQLPGIYEKTLSNGQVVLDYTKGFLELDYEYQDTLPDLPELKLSAQDGCGFCRLLRTKLREELVPKTRTLNQIIYLTNLQYSWKPPSNNHLSIYAWELCLLEVSARNAEGILITTLYFDVAHGGEFTSQYLPIHRQPYSETLSQTNIDAMKSWTKDCLNNHDECTRDNYIPKRLIDLGNNDQPLRLILTSEDERFSNEQDIPRYLALSYCWGPPDTTHRPLKTKMRSLRSRMRSIRIAGVPRTIADSFQVARVLGYQFIWVDSLCIIQDDITDWQKESVMMRRIFGSAAITLVAASSQSMHDGFLQRRKVELLPIPFSPSRHPGKDGCYYLQDQRVAGYLSDYKKNAVDVEWNRRGWTFQENMASQCLLYFGPVMTHYRCQMEIRTENTQEVRKPAAFVLSWSFDLKSRGVDVWSGVVEHYSGRRLTYMSDKLIALSSLAHDMKEKINGNYLAGIWKEDLVWGLLWECSSIDMNIYSDIAPSRCKIYRAPSWSWAAGDGAVKWYSRRKPKYFREEVVVKDVKTTAVEGSSLGAVTDGILILAGKLQHIEPATAQIWLDGGSKPESLSKPFGDYAASYSQISFDWNSPPDVINSICIEGIWLLLLATFDVGGGKLISGLLLSSANDKEQSLRTFRRVGMFRAYQTPDTSIFQDCLNEKVVII